MFAAGLMSLAASCAKEENAVENGVNEPAVTILASLEDDGTKVTVNNTTGKVEWAAGDKIAVYAGSYVESDGLAAAGNPGSFTFASLTDANRANFAIYPASAAVAGSVTASDLKVQYPATYALTDLNSEAAAPVMIAANAPATNLAFKHVGALLRITVNDVPKGVDELRVIFDKDVTGEFSVTGASTATPSVAVAAATSKNVVTFTFSALATMQNIVLSIPVPSGDLATVRVEAYAGGLPFPCGITFAGATGLQRTHAKKLTAYMPVFSVSATKKVVFSPGNLEAHTTDAGANWTWKFADEQYGLLASYATVDGKMHISTDEGARMHFRWSTVEAADYGINAEDTGTYYDYVGTTFQDWGTNPITWGTYTYPSNTWRTPSSALCYTFSRTYAGIDASLNGTRGELGYLFEERPASTVHGLVTHTGTDEEDMENARFVKVRLNSDDATRGVILFPDHFTFPDGVSKLPAYLNRTDAWYRTEFTFADWALLEAAGCVYIPRGDTFYYTSDYNVGDANGWGVNMLNIMSTGNDIRIGWGRPYQNYQVRLVRDAN